MNTTQDAILRLKQEKNAVIMAHYYETMDIQEIADVVGDSYALAVKAKETDASVIVLCGVRFMAESAKLLNPEKTVLLPSADAGCPMADMVTPQAVQTLRKLYPEAVVVCYVNSSAAVKAVSDVCCTSSSALQVVSALPQKQILFVPDKNLGRYVAQQLPEKEIICFEGYCPIHDRLSAEQVRKILAEHPGAKLLVHPECSEEVCSMADYIGSTAGILEQVQEDPEGSFVIATERGVLDRLNVICPQAKIWLADESVLLCRDMKKTTLEDVLHCLETGETEICLPPEEISAARASLDRMVAR